MVDRIVDRLYTDWPGGMLQETEVKDVLCDAMKRSRTNHCYIVTEARLCRASHILPAAVSTEKRDLIMLQLLLAMY